jgi:cytidine deaminase
VQQQPEVGSPLQGHLAAVRVVFDMQRTVTSMRINDHRFNTPPFNPLTADSSPVDAVGEAGVDAAVAAARAARDRSHAPYSRFMMGAAVVGADGVVTSGCLVESISLGLAMCAERVALFAAVTNATTPIRVVALVARRTAGGLTTPYGACLQVLSEHATSDCVVVCEDTAGQRAVYRLDELAPTLPLPATRGGREQAER